MAILVRSNREKPPWLDETREFCKGANIKIVGWGPDLLTVEAKSPSRAQEIACQLGNLGFHVIENEYDSDAGLLDLSKNPLAVQAKIASIDISQMRWIERISPLVALALGFLLLVPRPSNTREPSLIALPLGVLLWALFFWQGARVWGWRLELTPESLRVRRYYRWTSIPWANIRTIEAGTTGRNGGFVVVRLAPDSSMKLGRFDSAFAWSLRDRLRQELAQRR